MGPIEFYIKGGAPSTCAVGATLRAIPLGEQKSGAPVSGKAASWRGRGLVGEKVRTFEEKRASPEEGQ